LLKKTASLDSEDESLTMKRESGFFMAEINNQILMNDKDHN